MFSFITQRKAI